MFCRLLTLFLLLLTGTCPAATEPLLEQTAFFEAKIRPVLLDKCIQCHGPEKQKGGLRLDSREGLLAGSDNGPILAPADPDHSALVQALRWRDKDTKMPPKEQLPASVVKDFEEWVKMGAPDPRQASQAVAAGEATQIDPAQERQRWPYQPPQRPNANTDAQHPIDHFLLEKLKSKGLTFAPPADRRTLLRRATYDLTGLPPTPAEMEAFLQNESPGAFGHVVDRLLASPAYGEKWARHWLDVVRYVDGFGETNTNKDVTDAWRYRDWVVDSINHDLPFDQFARYHVAGDLLTTPDGRPFNRDGLIATSALMFGEWGRNDADLEKVYTDIVDDQIDLVSKSFLGLTVSCARCHDHKFDPISTADYYGLAGMFFSSHILPRPGAKVNAPEVLHRPLLPPQELAQREVEEKQISSLERRVSELIAGRNIDLAKSLWSRAADYALGAWDYWSRPPGDYAQLLSDFARARSLEPFALRQWIDYLRVNEERYLNVPAADYAGQTGVSGWSADMLQDAKAGAKTVLLTNPGQAPASFSNFTLPPRSIALQAGSSHGATLAWRAPVTAVVRLDGELEDAQSDSATEIEWWLEVRRRGIREMLAHGSVVPNMVQRLSSAAGGEKLGHIAVEAGDRVALVIQPKGENSGRVTCIALRIAELGGSAHWDLRDDLLADLHAKGAGNPHADSSGRPEVWHFLDRDIAPAPTNKFLATYPFFRLLEGERKIPGRQTRKEWTEAAENIQKQLTSNAAELERLMRNPSEWGKSKLLSAGSAAFYREITDSRSPFYNHTLSDFALSAAERKEVKALRSELAARKVRLGALPTANAIAEGGVPESPHAGFRNARIHKRGRYDSLGNEVPRAIPKVLVSDERQPQIGESESGRRQLAEWLGSKENPLLARVMVNRLWQHHFGEGIVRTPNNFGKMGAVPTHPELLDWLACEFMERGWSLKALHREIMLSTAYQQSSQPAAIAFEADPENALLSRFARRRLTAEELRDSVLLAAGTLDLACGGPAESEKNGFSRRRTLYVFAARGDARSFRAMFDAPDTNQPAERRTDSIVAPQALYFMNNDFVLAQCAALAARMKSAPGDDRTKLIDLYHRLYGRAATQEELALGQRLLARWGAEKGWMRLAQVLLCTNEFAFVD